MFNFWPFNVARKRRELAAIILLALVCAGCQPTPGTRSEPAGSMSVFIDPATGCEYLNYGGLTPRIDSDGLTHRGCRKTDRVSP